MFPKKGRKRSTTLMRISKGQWEAIKDFVKNWQFLHFYFRKILEFCLSNDG
jgi:hypothetical protein